MSDRKRQILAVSLCWAPALVFGISLVGMWSVVTGDITTQWSAGSPTTTAPAWTAALFVGGVCVVTGILATVAASDAPFRARRWAYFFCFGAACAALVVWFAILGANMADAQNAPMPNGLLLFPLAIPLGIVPWLIAGRGPAVEETVSRERDRESE